MKNLMLTLFCSFIFSCFPNSQAFAFASIMELEQTNQTPPQVLQIKKLKRKLLRNLVKDKLIASKKDFVKMDLPEGKIIVNGRELEGKLYKKYEGILLNAEVSHGERKAIHISPNFIKVGDFYDDCFRGSASGRMAISICGDDDMKGKKSKKSLF